MPTVPADADSDAGRVVQDRLALELGQPTAVIGAVVKVQQLGPVERPGGVVGRGPAQSAPRLGPEGEPRGQEVVELGRSPGSNASPMRTWTTDSARGPGQRRWDTYTISRPALVSTSRMRARVVGGRVGRCGRRPWPRTSTPAANRNHRRYGRPGRGRRCGRWSPRSSTPTGPADPPVPWRPSRRASDDPYLSRSTCQRSLPVQVSSACTPPGDRPVQERGARRHSCRITVVNDEFVEVAGRWSPATIPYGERHVLTPRLPVGVGPYDGPWPDDPRLDPGCSTTATPATSSTATATGGTRQSLPTSTPAGTPSTSPSRTGRTTSTSGRSFGTPTRSSPMRCTRRTAPVEPSRGDGHRSLPARAAPPGRAICCVGAGSDLPVLGVDNLPGSLAIDAYDLPRLRPAVRSGRSRSVRRGARRGRDVLHIPQFGSTRSINAGVAAGIAMYEWVRRHGS